MLPAEVVDEVDGAHIRPPPAPEAIPTYAEQTLTKFAATMEDEQDDKEREQLRINEGPTVPSLLASACFKRLTVIRVQNMEEEQPLSI
jgi:hypothetical protein